MTPVSARNDWLYSDPTYQTSSVEKAVDPIFINDGVDTIDIPVGEYWTLTYDLKKSKRYHIFLVGDWVKNDTDPITDYDIYTYLPDGSLYSTHTESAGIPEQVANDAMHQYFEPPQSGEYAFKIVNDERDSENQEPAIFMLLEHIGINGEYSRFLEGRDINDEEVLNTGWAFEFNTSSPQIRITVEVPEYLDMYEARLYAMANPVEGTGYDLYGIGVPLGSYFSGFSGAYGGFNTSSRGDRNIEAMDSGEYGGQDLAFTYTSPSPGSNIFYYLALIAEHGKGTVDFMARTDFDAPNVTLKDPPELCIQDEDTEIIVNVEDDSEIERVWIEHTTDGEEWREETLSIWDDGYGIILESYRAGDHVQYIVSAEDEFGNMGSVESEFIVKKTVTLECRLADVTIWGDERAEISGTSNLESAPLELVFVGEDDTQRFTTTTMDDGDFSMSFTPTCLGQWSLQAFFNGSALCLPAESNTLNFTVDSRRSQITVALSERSVKKNQPIILSGSVNPRGDGLPVEVLLVSSSESHSDNVSTRADGSYSYTFTPEVTGTWNVLTKFGDGFIHERSQSEILEFEVLPLNLVEKLLVVYTMITTPPFLYGTIGMVGLCVSSAFYIKRESVMSVLPQSITKKFSNGKKKKRSKKKAHRFRRSK